MIYYLLTVFSSHFLTVPLEKVAFATSCIYLMFNLIYIVTKYVIKLSKFKFLCNLIDCKAQEGDE